MTLWITAAGFPPIEMLSSRPDKAFPARETELLIADY